MSAPHDWPAIDPELTRLRRQRINVKACAEALRLPLITTQRRCIELGIGGQIGDRPGGEFWWPDEDDTLRQMRADGATSREIEAALPGRTYEAVKKRIKVLKLFVPGKAPAKSKPAPQPPFVSSGERQPAQKIGPAPGGPFPPVPMSAVTRPRLACDWPLWGHSERPTHAYCGAKASAGYCARHAALAVQQRERVAA